MIQDPAGLLQRIPELQALCTDARVRRAVEGGDAFEVYRALMWARWLGRLRSQRTTLDALLASRRLFARPLKGSPWLGTMNSVGASLVGAAEPDPRDGTSIATHAIVALFAMPLLPLGAYVVSPAQGSGPLSRSWSIFARVPLAPLSWLYSRAIALGVMALVAGGALRAFNDSRHQDVHLVNGLAQPLEVTLAGRTASVPPGEVRVLEVPTGVQRGRALTRDGVEVDQVELTVRSDVDVLGWNIAGAAPVFQDVVVYSSRKSARDEGAHEPREIYCGQRTFVVERAHDVFAKPPQTVSMSSSQSEVRRTYVDLARSDSAPLEMCLGYLSHVNRRSEALPFAEVAARLSGWAQAQTLRAYQVASSVGAEASARVMKEALAAHPDNVEFHRVYQEAAERAGQLELLRAQYRERAEREPGSGTAQYLHARLLGRGDIGPAMERLAERFPEDAVVLRSAVYSRAGRADWSAVHRGWERLRELDAAASLELLDFETQALVALGRGKEALALLQRTFATQEGNARYRVAELYARVARLQGSGAPDALLTQLEGAGGANEKLWLVRARAGLPTEGAPTSSLLQLMQAAAKDPDAAQKLALQVTQAEAPGLDHGTWALTYAEALRVGNAPVLQRLEGGGYVSPRSLASFERFVRGEAVDVEQLDVDRELRAAACLVRARNAALPRAERERLREQARRDDVLRGQVSEAVASWSL